MNLDEARILTRPKVNPGLFSSNSEEWETPQDLFDRLNATYNFDLDVCASAENAKCKKFITKETDSLSQNWAELAKGWCWMNPPYGKKIGLFTGKALEESKRGAKIVALLPARTDTKWFHYHIYEIAEIEFLRGRLRFGQSKNSAPFPSMLVIWGRN